MDDDVNIISLCTGNRARSIMAEALINARPGLRAWSAGSHPKDEPHPMGLDVLRERGVPTEGLASKSWVVFAQTNEDAPAFDIVLTLCDNAAGETCPLWHGAPVRAHWSLPDPAALDDGGRKPFETTYSRLTARIDRLAALPIRRMSPEALAQALNEIGRTTTP